jgi:murein DD-endopeptidase MepM/ murein hydrolase activator NlpD
LFALSWLLPATATAGNPPSQQQVDAAKQAYNDALGKLASIRSQVQAIQTQLNIASDKVDKQAQLVEEVTQELIQTRQRIADNMARYQKIRGQLNDRAVEAFMDGPGQSLGFILGATSLVDLSDRLEFVNAVTDSDANLAQRVDNIRAQLLADEAKLENLQQQRKDELKQLKATEEQIATSLRRVSDLQAQAAITVESTLNKLKGAKKSYADYLKQQAASAVIVDGNHAPVPLPAQYKDILKVCPVASPRAFGDGFGAPRYAGGFHLHAGVDVMANGGAEIYAPFDGVARTSYNTLGGNAVYVEGAQGYVYNAHLSAYSDKSNGPVKAGDVIGFVGDTGDAVGMHDHFEFHPYFPVPSDWPVSAYGYRVIGTALNPYPLLVAACG